VGRGAFRTRPLKEPREASAARVRRRACSVKASASRAIRRSGKGRIVSEQVDADAAPAERAI
jgi:hypothetical protein